MIAQNRGLEILNEVANSSNSNAKAKQSAGKALQRLSEINEIKEEVKSPRKNQLLVFKLRLLNKFCLEAFSYSIVHILFTRIIYDGVCLLKFFYKCTIHPKLGLNISLSNGSTVAKAFLRYQT